MTTNTGRRLWWLTVYDAQTGIATRVVGVVGTDGPHRHLTWIPMETGVSQWASALDASSGISDVEHAMTVDVDAAIELADGIMLGFIEVDDPPAAASLADAVAAAVELAVSASVESART